jgi:hypothetical protein
MEKYLANEDKTIIQIGHHMRKISSIYAVDSGEHKKLWLTGTRNFLKLECMIKEEIETFGLPETLVTDNPVTMTYVDSFDDYDECLSNNVVFIDLFDISASNTLVECMVRNTPIIVNKIEGVVEYLGADYPLYFNKLTDVPGLLDPLKITEAYEYLKTINKEALQINYFCSKLKNMSYTFFQKSGDQ